MRAVCFSSTCRACSLSWTACSCTARPSWSSSMTRTSSPNADRVVDVRPGCRAFHARPTKRTRCTWRGSARKPNASRSPALADTGGPARRWPASPSWTDCPVARAIAYVRAYYGSRAVETPWQRRFVARFRSHCARTGAAAAVQSHGKRARPQRVLPVTALRLTAGCPGAIVLKIGQP
jgi:hypothetical protein